MEILILKYLNSNYRVGFNGKTEIIIGINKNYIVTHSIQMEIIEIFSITDNEAEHIYGKWLWGELATLQKSLLDNDYVKLSSLLGDASDYYHTHYNND